MPSQAELLRGELSSGKENYRLAFGLPFSITVCRALPFGSPPESSSKAPFSGHPAQLASKRLRRSLTTTLS